MPGYKHYEARQLERLASTNNSDEENDDMNDLEELSQKADSVFEAQGVSYSDSDFGIQDEDLEDDDDFEFDDDDDEEEDAPEDEAPENDKVLSLDDILGAEDDEEDKLYIPQWGGNVVYRSVTKREFDNMRRMARSRSAKGKVNDILERELIMSGLVKPHLTVADYERLQEKSPGPFIAILNAIYRKSGLEREAEVERERRFPRKR